MRLGEHMPDHIKRAMVEGRARTRASNQDIPARDARIVSARKGGVTLVKCGLLFGVSGTRVKQICDKADATTQRRER